MEFCCEPKTTLKVSLFLKINNKKVDKARTFSVHFFPGDVLLILDSKSVCQFPFPRSVWARDRCSGRRPPGGRTDCSSPEKENIDWTPTEHAPSYSGRYRSCCLTPEGDPNPAQNLVIGTHWFIDEIQGCDCRSSPLKHVTSEVKVAQSDSLRPHRLYGIIQARILECVAFPFSRGSSQPRDQTQVSHIAGGFYTSWATREAQDYWSG